MLYHRLFLRRTITNNLSRQRRQTRIMASSNNLSDIVPPGVVTGDDLMALLEHARANSYAIPAVNCTSASAANAAMEAGKKAKAPVMIQLSYGGGEFVVGEGVSKKDNPDREAAILAGTIALAMHVRSVAKCYGVPVVLHSDHCAKNLLHWFDAMLEADEEFYGRNGEPLFSSHMLDLSGEPDEENIATCCDYFRRMVPMKIWLEMEIGITGGVEDGVDNEDCDPDELYTTPRQVWNAYEALSEIGPMFSIAAAFGNVHGVYKPGNVVLSPERLGHHQEHAKKMLLKQKKNGHSYDNRLDDDDFINKPIYLVMHGGSGSTDEEFETAVNNGVIKVNINTDTQWAYWDGVRLYAEEKREYLRGQIGNPDGPDRPNKKHYDGRAWLRRAEESMCQCVMDSMDKLFTTGRYVKTTKSGDGDEGGGDDNEDERPLYPQVGLIGCKPEPHPLVLLAAGAILGSAATLLLKFIRK